MKRQFDLSWDRDTMSDRVEYHRIVDMIKQEDKAFLFGKSDDSGNWLTQLDVIPLLEANSGSANIVTRSAHPTVGKNEYQGWYLKVYDTTTTEYLYLRIVSNTEGTGSAVTFVVADMPSTAVIAQNSELAIVYLPVKIDKQSAFSGSQYGYVSTPLTGYSLTLREVEL
jgi:hypothetical protein